MKCRVKAESTQHAAVQRELDAANERFKEFERRDVKLREDLKHLKAKRKKLMERLQRDAAKHTVRTRPTTPGPMDRSCAKMVPGSLLTDVPQREQCEAPLGQRAKKLVERLQRDAAKH